MREPLPDWRRTGATERGAGGRRRCGYLQPVRVGGHQRGEVAVEIPLIRHSGAGRTGSGANRKKQIDDAADIVPPLLAAAEQFLVQAADTRLALAPYRAETVPGASPRRACPAAGRRCRGTGDGADRYRAQGRRRAADYGWGYALLPSAAANLPPIRGLPAASAFSS